MDEDKVPDIAEPGPAAATIVLQQPEMVDEKPRKPERKRKNKGKKEAVNGVVTGSVEPVAEPSNSIKQTECLKMPEASSAAGPDLQNSTPKMPKDIKLQINRLREKLAKCSIKCSEVDLKKKVELPPPPQQHERKRRSKSERVSQLDLVVKTDKIRSMSFSMSSASTLDQTVDGSSPNRTKKSRGERANKNSDSISEPAKEASNETNAAESVSDAIPHRVKKLRGQRGKKKSTSALEPFYSTETPEIVLNAETFLLLDLLFMPPENRQNFIVNLARKKQILVMDNQTLKVNPVISRFREIFPYHDLAAHFGIKLEIKVDRVEPTERIVTLFEDYVNEIVGTDLTPEQKNEFTFPVTQKRQRKTNYYKQEEFEASLEEFAQKCVQANLGRIVEQEVRVSAKNNDHAFIKSWGSERDAMFKAQILRKGALHGDVVRAFIRKDAEQPDSSSVQNSNESTTSEADLTACLEGDSALPERSSKAFVIKIVKEVNNRRVVGNFLSHRKDSKYITFLPRDMKVPNLRIFEKHWPESFKNGKLDDIGNSLYVAEIIGWQDEICLGKILQPIGKCGELDSENKAILLQNNLDFEPYAEKFNEQYADAFVIPAEEYQKREDIRNECVFTIDPLTARDLDDALSCKQLHNGTFEIGVHISDVSYFLAEDDELDKIVEKRTTSVYMVNEVFHMLPKPLCYRCSLLPAEDKLTFSVFWTMSASGEILSTRFSRTVIKSCTQFAYQHAQLIIDNPEKEFHESDFPPIHNGFSVADVVLCVRQLNTLATILREKRFANGALKINKPKIYFDLHPETGVPVSFKACELLTANFMIEEFMLLANQSVARFIYDKFPDIAILRNHLPPLTNVMKRVKDQMKKMGLMIDVSSSKAIYDSLQRLIAESKDPEAMSVCLSQLLSKPMIRASYFCSEGKEYEQFWHYALSIPIYTHFTSPIRRYPDVLVHRVLSAALKYTEIPKRSPSILSDLTARCNEGKYNAKIAGEDSTDLYFFHYIRSKKSITVRAVVTGIYTYSFEAVLIDTGHQIMVSFKECKDVLVSVNKNDEGVFTAHILFEKHQNKMLKLQVSGDVWLEVTADKKRLRGQIVPSPLEIATSSEPADLNSVQLDSVAEKPQVKPRIGKHSVTKSQPEKQSAGLSLILKDSQPQLSEALLLCLMTELQDSSVLAQKPSELLESELASISASKTSGLPESGPVTVESPASGLLPALEPIKSESVASGSRPTEPDPSTLEPSASLKTSETSTMPETAASQSSEPPQSTETPQLSHLQVTTSHSNTQNYEKCD